ncbi:MAG TPA: DUF885 domain-containing protein [Candidatus Limnocylindrales bacterium]|nr:DUF885 domain-containing protein [Candidatus Limnocylindrales bacterium]
MSQFGKRVEAFLDEFFRLDPLRATEAGNHAHDAAWPDLSEAGREERLAFYRRWHDELDGLDVNALTPDEAVDRDLLLMELDAGAFAETDLRDEAWDALSWVYLLGGGLFPLLAREFAPLGQRLTSVAGRLEGIPAVVGAAIATLGSLDGRPASRFHVETALKQLPGVGELADDSLRAAEEGAGEPGVAEVRPRLEAAASGAKEALGRFEAHLREDVLPASEGEGRLGEALFTEKLRHTLRIPELTPERVLARAETEYEAVRTEMIRLARELWPKWCGGELPTDDGALVRGVLDAIALEHPPASELLDFCRAEIGRIEAFCRDVDLIGLAEEPLDIRWTPVFLRAFGGAMLDSPGPLDKGQKAFFSITPIPDDWTDEQAESYLREENARQLRLLTIHEGVPGHYLQGVYSNRSRSLARAIFWSGVFAEGYAVYVTQVMMDAGYGADDPALLLVHWKFYLRAVVNAIIDVRIHTAGMTEDEGVSLMVDGGFQEEAEARNKYNRARLSSTQLSTYFIGSNEFWELERAVRRRAAGGEVVPERALPGGFGATPGFEYRPFLENILSHGTPPTSLLKRIVLGS